MKKQSVSSREFLTRTLALLSLVVISACDKGSGNFSDTAGNTVFSSPNGQGQTGEVADSVPSDLVASFTNSPVAVNGTGHLVVTTTNVTGISYQCSNGQNGSLSLVDGASITQVSANRDLSCVVSGVDPANQLVSQTANLSITCSGELVKQGGVCIPYSCQSFVAIDPSASDIPARDASGTCYYMKLFDDLAFQQSFGPRLPNVIARDHDRSADSVNNPYILGQSQIRVKLAGDRTIKLSGSSQALDPILVDNFILIGTRLASTDPSLTMFSAFGTGDSTILGTDGVKVNNRNVHLTQFESAGTATIKALTLTDQFQIGKTNFLSVDALDCGGSRQLSEIYLVFQ